MENQRVERINAEITKVLSSALLKLNNPKLQGVLTIASVKTSPDFAVCRISVSSLENDEAKRKDILNSLIKSAGFFKKELADNLKMRQVPKLVFDLNDNVQYSMKINEILKKLNIHKSEEEEEEDGEEE